MWKEKENNTKLFSMTKSFFYWQILNLAEEKISQEFTLKIWEKTRNYFNKGIDKNELMSNKHKKDIMNNFLF